MKDIELILILCQYYFDGGKEIEKFTTRFNQYFQKDVSPQTLLYAISRFKNVDPANNTGVKGDEYARLWNEYVTNDKIQSLKELHKCFKSGMYAHPMEELVDEPAAPRVIIKAPQEVVVNDVPIPRPEGYSLKGSAAYKRSAEVVSNALAIAGYKCEMDCGTKLFIRKAVAIPYTEAHHLIPLCFQSEFLNSLDVEANVISLCPNCHRRLHYGAEIEPLLWKLYANRYDRLKKCGIEISYEKLLLLYR